MTQQLDINGVVACNWSLIHRQNRMFSEDGKGNVYNFGDPYWVVEMEWVKTSDAQFRAVSALLQRLEGGNDNILLWNLARQAPTNFDGPSAVVNSLSVDVGTKVVTINTNGNLAVGDFVAWDTTSGGRFVGEVNEVLTTPDANTTTFKTSPPAYEDHATANAAVWRATGLFKMEADSLEVAESLGAGPGKIKARFRQVSP